MKLLSNISRNIKESLKDDRPILCEFLSTPRGIIKLDTPVISCEKECDLCGSTACYCPLVDPEQSAARTWLCANPHCDVYKSVSDTLPRQTTVNRGRAVLWPKFCELNGIGDENYNVKFEEITQNVSKVSYLLKFATNPRGIILMRGETGTGKTYSSMAVCELFTRTNTSAIFCTQKQMLSKWLDTFKAGEYNNFIERVTNCNLLVIDDFGIGEMSPGFLGFFMDLVNTRLQWTNRGTIVSTNLNKKDFSKTCGQALLDRISTGQEFEFVGDSKRKKTVL